VIVIINVFLATDAVLWVAALVFERLIAMGMRRAYFGRSNKINKKIVTRREEKEKRKRMTTGFQASWIRS